MVVTPASAAAAWPEVVLRLVARLATHGRQALGAYVPSTEPHPIPCRIIGVTRH